MTSLREAVRRLLAGGASAAPDPAYSYRIHWVGEARKWDARRRARALQALRALTSRPDFAAAGSQPRYHAPEVDGRPHDAASILALIDVLETMARSDLLDRGTAAGGGPPGPDGGE